MWMCLAGVHWLGATFWMVSQQTDIIRSTNRWRLFNLVMGAVHVFLFLNLKHGQSRYRMAGFYLVCLIKQSDISYQPNMRHILGFRRSTNFLLLCFFFRPCFWRMLFSFWPPLGCLPWCPGTQWASQQLCSAASSLVRCMLY